MLKRRSAWFGGGASLLLVLSMSGIVAGAEDLTPPDAAPVVVDTTATFEDVDANGIDDDCQTEAAVAADAATVAAAEAAVDTNADGVISTTEAAHSPRIGGKNCNQGGYVSWIAHQKHACTAEPTVDPTVEPTVGETVELVVSEPNEDVDGTEPEVVEPDADACDADSAIDGAKKDKVAAAAARAASKAERALARAAARAERTAAHAASKAERNAAKAASKAERNAAKAVSRAARAHGKGH